MSIRDSPLPRQVQLSNCPVGLLLLLLLLLWLLEVLQQQLVEVLLVLMLQLGNGDEYPKENLCAG